MKPSKPRQMGGPSESIEIAPFDPIPLSNDQPHGGHRSSTLANQIYGFNIPPGARFLLVQAIGNNVRYTLDGSNPSATSGFRLLMSDPPVLIPIAGHTVIKVIREGAGVTLEYQWCE